MKKHVFLASLILAFTALPIAAFDCGPLFAAGIDTSVIKPYTYESASFKFNWDTGLGFDVGCRFMQNILKNPNEPVAYFAPDINLYYKYFYLGGGLLLNNQMQSSEELTFVARTGASVPCWDWGIGKGGFDAGLEVSPTAYIIEATSSDAKDQIGAGIGSFFSTLLNVFKINIGITYYLPVTGKATPIELDEENIL